MAMAAGKTEINRKVYSATELNFEAQQPSASSTVINTEFSGSPAIQNGNSTAINTELNTSTQGIEAGTLLLNKYLVEKPLSSNTGEASLYICSYNGKKYVAKVYRRVSAIKDEVLEVLKQLDSPYVARVCDVGDWGGYPFVVIPYYKEGSLENRPFSQLTTVCLDIHIFPATSACVSLAFTLAAASEICNFSTFSHLFYLHFNTFLLLFT